jgi:hypothetical protein
LTATLSPLSSAVATRRWRSSCWRAARASRGASRLGRGCLSTTRAVANFALDKGESSLAILLAIALVNVGVVASAAVRVSAVAVALDLACGLSSVLDERSSGQDHATLTEQV